MTGSTSPKSGYWEIVLCSTCLVLADSHSRLTHVSGMLAGCSMSILVMVRSCRACVICCCVGLLCRFKLEDIFNAVATLEAQEQDVSKLVFASRLVNSIRCQRQHDCMLAWPAGVPGALARSPFSSGSMHAATDGICTSVAFLPTSYDGSLRLHTGIT